jgi:hypothetical protein
MLPRWPVRETPAVKAGKHKPPVCEHGEWTFAGSDAKRRAAKWRCLTGECTPASRWIRASRLHTVIPRGTARWKKLDRQRGSVEREFGRLKNEWALLPLRVRRIERVALHTDLTILAGWQRRWPRPERCRWPRSGQCLPCLPRLQPPIGSRLGGAKASCSGPS